MQRSVQKTFRNSWIFEGNTPQDLLYVAIILLLERQVEITFKLAEALSLFLPQSSVFSTLSNLPPPDPTNPTSTSTFTAQSAVYDGLPTLEEIVSLYEEDEDQTFTQELDKRRKRLGAPSPAVIRKEVGREVWGKSRVSRTLPWKLTRLLNKIQLPEYYNEVLNHPNTSDELRRQTESKLFRLKERYLYVLPVTGEFAQAKQNVAQELDELVNGIVLLGIPDESAWTFYLEGQDWYSTGRSSDFQTLLTSECIWFAEEYNVSELQRFITLFPIAALSKMLKAYFKYMSIPILGEDGSGSDDEEAHDDDGDPYDAMLVNSF